MKRMLISLFAGAMVLAMAGMAGAQCTVNMYGASAQGEFWDAGIKTWMELPLANGGAGCTAPITGPTKYTDAATGITHVLATGSGCDIPSCANIVIRYSSKSSCDGIKAVAGVGDPDSCGNSSLRKMLVTAPSTLGCVDVTHGSSDVAPASLIQVSAGQNLGPLGGGFVNKTACGVAQNPAWSVHRPFVVPFGFFLNNAVTQKRCDGGTNVGEICDTNAQCPAPGLCTAQPLPDMSRLMAVMIFSGQAWNWNDFGASFPAGLPIEACFRHAGSGTHATLDFAVMRGRDWGWPLPTLENKSPAQPTIYFNSSTGDLMKCVNGQGDGLNAPLSGGNNTTGRAGYADADRANSTYTYGPVKYNGYKPFRTNVRNGLYDNFWSSAYVFDDCGTVPGCLPVQNSMFAWASANVPSAKGQYWTPGCEMAFMKATDDAYPGYQGATCAAIP